MLVLPKSLYLLSGLIGFLLVFASGSGLIFESVYSKSSLSWIAQSQAQDLITLFLVVPGLLFSTYLAKRGSLKAYFVWLGLLMYSVYTYIMYVLLNYFSWFFFVYLAILSLSFFVLVYGLTKANLNVIDKIFKNNPKTGFVKWFLLGNGLLFTFIWLSEIIQSLVTNTIPQTSGDAGLTVNFVHVLDLGFVIPAFFLTSFYLSQKRNVGHLFASPLLVFLIFMEAAIVSMMVFAYRVGISSSFIPALPMGMIVLIGIAVLSLYFKEAKR